MGGCLCSLGCVKAMATREGFAALSGHGSSGGVGGGCSFAGLAVSVQTPECRCWPLLSPRVCYLIPTGCWRVKNFSLYRESGFVENNLTDFSLLFSPCSIVCKTRVAHGTNSHEVSGSFDCPVSPSPPMPPPFQLTVSLWEPAGVCVPDLTPAAPAPCPAPACGFVRGLQLLPVPVLSPGVGWVCQGSACPP